MIRDLHAAVGARGWLSGSYDVAEAFAGSGALSLSLLESPPAGAARPRSVQLWDAVRPLLALHATLRGQPEAVCAEVRELQQRSGVLTREVYERLRADLNVERARVSASPRLAALFLICNWAGYNGLWRANRKGENNTPWGGWTFEADWDVLCAQVTRTGQALQRAPLHTRVWDARLDATPIPLVPARTILFVDPPYVGTYSGYAGTWGEADFARLREHLLTWAAHHVRVLVTFPLAGIHLLPANWPYTVLSVPNMVGGTKSQRNAREEVLMLSPPRTP